MACTGILYFKFIVRVKKTLLDLWTKFSNSGHSALDESTVRQLSSVAKRTLLVESFAKT